jgi:TonB-dependent receptor
MNISRLTVALMVVLLLGSSCLFAQDESGQISGTVKDVATGAALPGASIWLKGTSLGASSNLTGFYVISRVPPGSYTLVVRFIGYVGKEIVVEVKPGSTFEQNFSLLVQAVEGEEVVVTVQRRGQEAAINQQLSSNTITNVVSAERIHELPDASAAAALARLPGVSLMLGDEVVVRGVEAKMNQILLNGVRIPSTNMFDRSVNLGFISSNMLSGIEVTKAITPDMDANAIGGVVNLTLREAPEEFHFDILAQGGYLSLARSTDNYKLWFSASDRFFENSLGVFVQASADRSLTGDDHGSLGFEQVGSANYGEGVYRTSSATFSLDDNTLMNSGGSIVLDYKLPNGKIILQNNYSHGDNDLATMTDRYNFGGNGSLVYALNRNAFGRDLWINGLQVTNNFGDLKVDLNLSHSSANKYTQIAYGWSGDNVTFGNQVNAYPFGRSADGQRRTYESLMQYLTLEGVYGLYINPTDPDSSDFNGWVRAHNETFDEHIYNAALDITLPVSLSNDVSAKFKAGAKVMRMARSDKDWVTFKGTADPQLYGPSVRNMFPGKTLNASTNLSRLLLSDIVREDFKRANNFLNGNYVFRAPIDKTIYDIFMSQSQMDWNPKIYWPGTDNNDFWGAELFSAAYLMGTFDIGQDLTIMAGARIEQYNMHYKANFTYVTHSVYGDAFLMPQASLDAAGISTSVDRTDNNIFPNAQIRYKFNDWSDVRIAFTEGIARPDYDRILPRIYFAPGEFAIAGNTRLKPAFSTNLDLALSFYSNEIGLLTIAPFYKKIIDFNYNASIFFNDLGRYDVSFPDSVQWVNMGYTGTQMPPASQKISCYVNNPYPALVRGFEVEWQTNFWYLPKPFNTFVLNVNYTKTWSDMDYQQQLYSVENIKQGRFTIQKYHTMDTVRNARLLYQPNDVVNVSFGADYKGFSGRLSFNLQGNIMTAIGTRPEESSYTGNIYRWDITLQQKLPIEGLSVALSGTNLFNNPIYTYQDFRREVDGPILHNEQSIDYSPRTILLNVRYSY